MRSLRIILSIAGVIAVFVAVGVAGFAAGWVSNDVAHPNRVEVSGAERADAQAAGDLVQGLIEQLQGGYYKGVDVDKLKTGAARGALKPLKDPYSVYMTPEESKKFHEITTGKYSGIGAVLEKKGDRLLITDVIDDSPAKDAGVRPGDVIVTVDGESTAARSLEVNVSHIKGDAGSKVRLQIRRKGEARLIELTLTRRDISVPETKTRLIHRDGQTVGYVELYDFAQGVGDTVRDDVRSLQERGAQSIVFDLRFNGGGLISEAVDVTSVFLQDGVVVTTEGLHSPKQVYSANGHAATDLPLVVLVNQYTASASEITAGALQDHDRATIVGARTFGKGLVQTMLELPGGASLKMTTAVYLTPDGRDINHKGIEPDVTGPDAPKTKRDEGLQRALDFLVSGR